MKCQTLISGKKKRKNINLWSAEFAQRVLEINYITAVQCTFVFYVKWFYKNKYVCYVRCGDSVNSSLRFNLFRALGSYPYYTYLQ